jgi:hypothetical protein
MTHGNRRDFLTLHWAMVAEEKMYGLAGLLKKRQRENNKLLAKLNADHTRLLQKAGGEAEAKEGEELFLAWMRGERRGTSVKEEQEVSK